MSPLTRLYLLFSRYSAPLWRMAHRKRLTSGKEVPARLSERYGHYVQDRPTGCVIWFHALSVGESLALVPLIEHALNERPEAHVVLTSSTVTSVRALEGAGLPDRCFHVFQPIDTAAAVGRFLDHWRPDFAGFAELDFWPRLMIDTARRDVPMILLNSRMPAGNFARRSRIKGSTRDVLRLFDKLLVQDNASEARFIELGAHADRIEVVGALKAVARPLPAPTEELARLQAQLNGRPIWLASSTFETEQAEVVAAQKHLHSMLPGALMIWAPRHLRDADQAAVLAKDAGLKVARRSLGEGIDPDVDVYLADTIGEMGLWYRLAPISFMGHSLFSDLEGKNPFEAVALGSVILHGPHMSYFAESYAGLAAEGAAREITDAASLAEAVLELQSDKARSAMVAGADRAVRAQRDVLYRTWDAIEALMR